MVFIDTALLCKLSYLEPQTFNEELKKQFDFEKPALFINDVRLNVEAYFIEQDNETAIIVFRGSSSIRDFMTDFDARMTKTNLGWVHRGFYRAWSSIRYKVEDAVKAYSNLIVCGHSMGGALAVLCCKDLYRKNVSCITYGCPRVGGRRFVKEFNALIPNSMRYVCLSDPVTHMPTAWRFRHVSNVKILDAGKMPWWKKWLVMFWDITTSPFDDHDMDYYIQCLKQRNSCTYDTAA